MENRRPIKARTTQWAKRITNYLLEYNITPNQISLLSILFSILGAISLIYFPYYLGFIFCAVFIQLRLLCNLLDGMVAIEGGKKSSSGVIFNEFPDRVADSFLLIALGFASSHPNLGWLAALLAMGTAYIRVFAGSVNIQQPFIGPMAKQHRMALMTFACLLGQFELWLFNTTAIISLSLYIIIIGCIITCYRRTTLIKNRLQLLNKDN